MNYARKIGAPERKAEYLFFSGDMPRLGSSPEKWAFFEVPANRDPATFTGRLVGEGSEARCIRLSHAPKDKHCSICRLRSQQ